MTTLAEKRKLQKRLFLLLAGAILAGSAALYFGFFRKTGLDLPDVEVAPRTKTLTRMKLNLDILRDKRFLDLTPYSRLPLEVETGRDNPFSDYSEEVSISARGEVFGEVEGETGP